MQLNIYFKLELIYSCNRYLEISFVVIDYCFLFIIFLFFTILLFFIVLIVEKLKKIV